MFISYSNFRLMKVLYFEIEVEFVNEIFYGINVEVRSYIEKIGNSSFVVYQEGWQSDHLVAKGRATMVHFDHAKKKSMPIPEEKRKQLNEHLIDKTS